MIELEVCWKMSTVQPCEQSQGDVADEHCVLSTAGCHD